VLRTPENACCVAALHNLTLLHNCDTVADGGHRKQIVGLEIDWTEVEKLYEAVGLPPAVSPIASRVAVPVFRNGTQIGKATSTSWSPVLKKMIGLATIMREYGKPGTQIEVEITVEAIRHRVPARVMKTPFYNPKQKTAPPVL